MESGRKTRESVIKKEDGEENTRKKCQERGEGEKKEKTVKKKTIPEGGRVLGEGIEEKWEKCQKIYNAEERKDDELAW